MSDAGETAPEGAYDTPWGPVTLRTSPAHGGPDGCVGSGPVVDTGHGKAKVSFHADFHEGVPPASLRVVLACGYKGRLERPDDPSRVTGFSVGGAPVGWQVQEFLDPETGEPVEHGFAGVMLVDRDNRYLDDFHTAKRNLRESIRGTLRAAHEADPAFLPRLYAGMMGSVVAGLDVDLAAAERRVDEIRAMRDTAAESLDKAKWAAVWADEAAKGPAGP